MKTCLLVINYNGIWFLRKYLFDICKLCNKNNITLIVTDDNSSDDSIKFLKENDYRYTVNQNKKHGFAANVNNGLKYALEIENFDYFIIANNDVVIRDGMFEQMNKTIYYLSNIDQMLGIVGFDEIDKNKKDYFETFDFNKYTINEIKKVKDVPGFFFLLSKNLLNKIGFLDEDYFMYGEDNDYFSRTLKASFNIYNTYLPVLHYSESSSSNDKLTSWLVYRNAFLFAQKNLSIINSLKLFLSFINIIYNPFYKINSPSSYRIRRNGFIINNYMLLKSIYWNLNFFIKNIKKKYTYE